MNCCYQLNHKLHILRYISQYNSHHSKVSSVQSLSSVQLFATPWTAACQASVSITNGRSLPKLMSIETVMPSYYLLLCCPLLLLPSVHRVRWPKYWSFSFSIGHSNSGLISFRMNKLDLLAVQGTFKELSPHRSSKALKSIDTQLSLQKFSRPSLPAQVQMH